MNTLIPVTSYDISKWKVRMHRKKQSDNVYLCSVHAYPWYRMYYFCSVSNTRNQKWSLVIFISFAEIVFSIILCFLSRVPVILLLCCSYCVHHTGLMKHRHISVSCKLTFVAVYYGFFHLWASPIKEIPNGSNIYFFFLIIVSGISISLWVKRNYEHSTCQIVFSCVLL